jgi:predicted unusual protein kinase regulating ubiquinone biosynthesis (AarF/ABC1/UbiB family)
VTAGNLRVPPDGCVGFIDFGIVGRVSPVVHAKCYNGAYLLLRLQATC